MNYHDIKILHIFFAFTMMLSTFLMMNSTSKLQKFIFVITSLAAMITGIVIVQRFGITFSKLPFWVMLKMGFWLLIVIATPIVVKRFPKQKKLLALPWTVLLFVSIALAVYKPM